MFNPEVLSQIISNSFLHHNWIKPNRLDGEKLSLQEAETWFSKIWEDLADRIVIWLNDNWELILQDGRHLLEAYRLLQKLIPEYKVKFTSSSVRNLLNKHLK